MMVDGKPRKPTGLGRGLSALLGDTPAETGGGGPSGPAGLGTMVPIEFLKPNPFQPRTFFDDEKIQDLVASIRENGILQPILVRTVSGAKNSYEIIAGERRWRAAQAAQLHEVPVVIRNLNDAETLEVALVENVQREDLNPIEEAVAYRRLAREFSYSQDQLSIAVGKSRSHVANMMRLLDLPQVVQDMVADNRLSMGHARALITAKDSVALAKEVIHRGLNVRQTETLVRKQSESPKSPQAKAQKDVNTLELERNISAALGLQVTITDHGARGGEMRIRYRTLDQLDEICRRLCHIVDIKE